jgi:hypothetical protein
MARDVLLSRQLDADTVVEAAIHYDADRFGAPGGGVTPWTVAIAAGGRDIGRLVGFEGDAPTIIAMHGLKPDPDAQRGFEITVFRASDEMRERRLDAAVMGALERWLLKRGWKGNLIKKLAYTDASQVIPIRRFWLGLGFELIPGEEGRWDEHVTKRWR